MQEPGELLGAEERQVSALCDLEHKRHEALLRRRMTRLLHGPTLKPVIRQIEQKVEKKALAIREPLNLAADVPSHASNLARLPSSHAAGSIRCLRARRSGCGTTCSAC